MGPRIARIVVVFGAVGLLSALTSDSLPGWVHLTVLAGGLWVALRLWEGGANWRGRRGR